MTVQATTTKTIQACNGSLTEFSFDFAIYKEEDITVIIRNAANNEYLLVLGTDYTISSDNLEDGGVVNTIKEVDEEFIPFAYPVGSTITIMLNLPLTQETDLIYGGAYSSEAIEKMSDKLTRITQQLSEQLERTVKLRKSSDQSDIELENLEAGKIIIVNSDGDGLEMGSFEEGGEAIISNDPYDKDTWNGVIAAAPSKNVVRDELVNHRFTKGETYSTIFALSPGQVTVLPISNTAYGASWATITRTAASKKAIYDKIEAMGAGAGDVVGPATHAADYVPQWNGTPNSKVLVAGFTITAAGKALLDDADAAAQRTTLGLGSAALRIAEDALTDGSNLPDGHAIKTYGDANWGSGSGDVVGPAAATNNGIPLFDGTTGKLIRDTTRLIEDTLSDGSNLPDGAAIKTYGDANWGGFTNLTEFLTQTAWRLFYANADGDVTELALGTAGQYLKANGVAAAPTWAVPGGAGDVVGPAAHAADYVPQWNGTPNSKVLVAGFTITAAGKALLDDADAAAQRTTLGLGSAALRIAEDALTDGSNLPDGHAIKTYGDANWGGAGGNQWEQHSGYQAGHNLTTGVKNALVGYQAGYSQSSTGYNCSIGYKAGYSQSTAYADSGCNVSIGAYAGYTNYYNAAMYNHTNGMGKCNVFIGAFAGYYTYGGYNTFIGMEAGHYNKFGFDNTFIGLCAGRWAGKVSAGGNCNCCLGSNAGIMQDSGDNNTYLGTSAGYGGFAGGDPENPNPPQGSGSNNVAIGNAALYRQTSGHDNYVGGGYAGQYLTTGYYNTGIGRSCFPYITSGYSNVAIGYYAGAGITTLHNAVCIGKNSNVTVSDGFVLGVGNTCVGIRKNNPSVPLDVVGAIRTAGVGANIESGYNISVPTNRVMLLDGISGNTGFYYDGSYIRLVKNGAVVQTW